MRVTAKGRESAIETLRKILPPGATVYITLRHVSRSGMIRIIKCFAVVDGTPMWLSGLIARATGTTYSERYEDLSVQGCGMDMGYHVVHNLSATLYKGGFGCTGEGCPSNDHSNGDRDYTPHGSEEARTGADGSLCKCHRHHWHKEAGYALKHRWV